MCKRIIDDVRYEQIKYKRLPKEERIGYMVDVGLKEGMLDVIRDYRYEFQKKMEKVLEDLSVHYDAFANKESPIAFDAKAFCEEHFSKTMIFKNSTALVVHINRTIASDAKKEKGVLERAIEALVHAEIKALKQTLTQTLSSLNEALLEQFVSIINAPAIEIESHMQRTEEMLRGTLERLLEHQEDEGEQKRVLEQRLACVEEVLEALDFLQN